MILKNKIIHYGIPSLNITVEFVNEKIGKGHEQVIYVSVMTDKGLELAGNNNIKGCHFIRPETDVDDLLMAVRLGEVFKEVKAKAIELVNKDCFLDIGEEGYDFLTVQRTFKSSFLNKFYDCPETKHFDLFDLSVNGSRLTTIKNAIPIKIFNNGSFNVKIIRNNMGALEFHTYAPIINQNQLKKFIESNEFNKRNNPFINYDHILSLLE